MNSQQEIWEQEHKTPTVLLQMDSSEVSSGVLKFWQWLQVHSHYPAKVGLEIGCGKGRNSIWLARQGMQMIGYDFAPSAVNEALERATKLSLTLEQANFAVQDVTQPFSLRPNCIDFAIDCFASTDIDSYEGRVSARNNIYNVLKPEGLLFVYSLSTEDEFHRHLLDRHPVEEHNAFRHPQTQKFEKIFTKQELLEFYSNFKVIEYQTVTKKAVFFDKEYDCQHHWLVLQKP